MKIREKVLLQIMDEDALSCESLADGLDLHISVVEKMLNGEAVKDDVALKLMSYFGAEDAQRLVDWEAEDEENDDDDDCDDDYGGDDYG